MHPWDRVCFPSDQVVKIPIAKVEVEIAFIFGSKLIYAAHFVCASSATFPDSVFSISRH